MTGFSDDPAPFAARLDKAAFFAWVQAQEGGRFELKDGHIVMHAGSSNAHWAVSSRFAAALSTRLDWNAWICGMADLAIEIGEDVRYPDVVVHALADLKGQGAAKRPIVLVEVLSPSSVSRDMHLKLAEYTLLPSLQAYVVASQDAAILWAWQRDGDTGAFPAQPEEIAGLEGSLILRALGVTLPLAEIYRGVLAGGTS